MSHHPGSSDWRAWVAEAVGTALLVLAIVVGAALSLAEGSALSESLPGPGARFLALGVLVAPIVAALAVSPVGRASGAHLNPAVTLAFWVLGRVGGWKLAGYVAAQLAGALAGAAAGEAVLPSGTWRSIGGTVTHPGVSTGAAFALEAGMTALLLVVILAFSSRERIARLTPIAVVPVLTAIIWLGSPWTGASINPARSEGPAVAFGDLSDLWLYLVAPSAAGVLVGLGWRFLRVLARAPQACP
jgi:glycerol uptake facilitator-like aquaporin